MKKILVTGSAGLVGSALKLFEPFYPYEFIFADRNTCDLVDQESAYWLITNYQPDAVIHTAARVGGIGRNLASPYEQYTENIFMNTALIDACLKFGVKKLIAYSSVCVFDKYATKLYEDCLQQGEPYPAHKYYAYSKRMGS